MKKRFHREHGQGLIEYGLILLLISMAIFATIVFLGDDLRQTFEQITDGVNQPTANQKEINYYQAIRENEQTWIAEIQLENGAIPFRGISGNKANINPYFSNIAASGLLSNSPEEINKDCITRYIDWYLSHLNSAGDDLYGVDGTIYDYTITTDNNGNITETSKKSYDSVDSYAATFISVVREYYDKTGDKDYILANKTNILRVIRALNNSIDTDGLSIAKIGYPIKYLMDNAEVNQGLNDANQLMDQIFLIDETTPDHETLVTLNENIKSAIIKNNETTEQRLWNATENRYEIGIDNGNNIITFDGWDHFYPDATAQLFPMIYDVSTDKSRNQQIYQQFCNTYNWENFSHYDNDDASFYWPLLTYVAATQNDETRVKTYLQQYQNRTNNKHPYPVYIADAGWIIKTCNAMETYHQTLEKYN